MTVDELLLKLDAEYEKITGELPGLFQGYGRYAYSYPNDTNVYLYEKEEIKKKLARQEQILDRQNIIRQEINR